jgi:eukaryotic-like serine/threonine-protein kinase
VQRGCVVPNLKGKTLAQTRRLLGAGRCSLGKVTRAYSAKVKKGRIIRQNRRPGARLARGSRVNVVLSRGRNRR